MNQYKEIGDKLFLVSFEVYAKFLGIVSKLHERLRPTLRRIYTDLDRHRKCFGFYGKIL